MNRRSFTGMAIATCAAGCATRQPPRPLPELRQVGMLPILERVQEGGSTAPFDFSMLPFRSSGGARMIGLPGLVQSMDDAKEVRRRQLAVALVPVGFSARTTIVDHMALLIQQRGLPIVLIEPVPTWAFPLRDDDNFKNVPQTWDAILDVQIHEAGYYADNGGFTPRLSVTSRLIDPRPPAQVAERFAYDIDSGDSKGDPRYFSAPSALMIPTLDAFRDHAIAIKRDLTSVCKLVTDKMVDDLERVTKRLSKVA